MKAEICKAIHIDHRVIEPKDFKLAAANSEDLDIVVAVTIPDSVEKYKLNLVLRFDNFTDDEPNIELISELLELGFSENFIAAVRYAIWNEINFVIFDLEGTDLVPMLGIYEDAWEEVQENENEFWASVIESPSKVSTQET